MESFLMFTEAQAKVETHKYSWGTMKTVHHGASFSIPLHPEHHQAIHKLKDGESHHFTDETKSKWKATREGDKVHFHGDGPGNRGYKTSVSHEHMKEDVNVTEEKDTIVRDAQGKLKSWKHEGDWHKSSGTITDKSGAKHTPYSQARSLARNALKKTLKKEEVQLDEGAYEKAEENKRSADAAKKQGDMFAHHLHMADHHDNMAEWHDSKGRHNVADQHMKKSEEHQKKAQGFKEETSKKAVEESAPVAPAPHIHRIGVTVSDPNHTMVTQRKEKQQKFVRVSHHNDNKDEAIARGKKHFAKKGWKVHDAWHTGMVHEEVEQMDELSNQLLQRYKDKAMKSADALAAKGQHSKANDRYLKHMQASGKQIDTTMKKIHARMNKEDVELEEATKDQLRAALARHEQNALDANRRGDHDAVKMHQERMNKVKDKMAKLARSE